MRRTLLSSALALSLLAVPLAARAQQASSAPPAGGPRAQLHAIFAQLELTPDEKTALKSLREQKSPDEKAARHELREAKRAFAQALQSDADDTAMRAAHDQLAARREAYEKVRFEGLLAVRKVFTAEQRKKFDSLYLDYKRGAARAAAQE